MKFESTYTLVWAKPCALLYIKPDEVPKLKKKHYIFMIIVYLYITIGLFLYILVNIYGHKNHASKTKLKSLNILPQNETM